MTTMQLRKEIKRVVDQLPSERLVSLADFVRFLNRPDLAQRLTDAEKDFACGRGVNWRKVRSDV